MEACFASMLIRGPTVGRDFLLSLLYKCHVLSRDCMLASCKTEHVQLQHGSHLGHSLPDADLKAVPALKSLFRSTSG